MHYQFGGSEAAFELVTQYCRQSDRFDELGQREKWDSITHETENPVTMASLIAIANKARRERERKDILNLLNDDSDEQGSAVDFYSELQMGKNGTARQSGERHDVPQSRSRAYQHCGLDRMRLVPMLQRPIPGTKRGSLCPATAERH